MKVLFRGGTLEHVVAMLDGIRVCSVPVGWNTTGTAGTLLEHGGDF